MSVPNLYVREMEDGVLINKVASQKLESQNRMSSTISTYTDSTSRMSELGKMLKRLLDPGKDTLLRGYSELIALVKTTTVSAKEKRKAEEDAFFQAKIARFDRDRRQFIKKDDVMREFLIEKKV